MAVSLTRPRDEHTGYELQPGGKEAKLLWSLAESGVGETGAEAAMAHVCRDGRLELAMAYHGDPARGGALPPLGRALNLEGEDGMQSVLRSGRPCQRELLLALGTSRRRTRFILMAPMDQQGVFTVIKEARRFTPVETREIVRLAQAAGRALKALRRGGGREPDARDALLGMVAHDLAGQLTSLLLQLDRARMVPKGVAPPDLARIHATARDMRRLVEDLGERELLRSGRLSVRLRHVELGEVFRDLDRNMRPLAREAGVRLVIPRGCKLTVPCDPERMLQVLSNLVRNALRVSAKAATVRLRARVDEKQNMMAIVVRDQGPGFGSSEPQGGEGLGLGLRICRDLIEGHNGRLQLGRGPRGGAEVTILIPLRQTPPKRKSPVSVQPKPAAGTENDEMRHFVSMEAI